MEGIMCLICNGSVRLFLAKVDEQKKEAPPAKEQAAKK
jgi:hypothetical protein